MTDLELVNAFLAKPDMTPAEEVLKNKCLTLDQRLNAAREEFKELNDQHAGKQRELVALSSQLDGILQVVLEVAKGQEESLGTPAAPAPVEMSEDSVDQSAEG